MKPLPLLFATVALAATGVAQIANAPCWESNFGTAQNLGYYSHVTYATQLGFSFPFAGTNYSQIGIASDGYVYLGGGTWTMLGYGASESAFLASTRPVIACYWMMTYTMYASSYGYGVPGQNVYFNSFPATATSPARAVVTWYEVMAYYQGPNCSMQLQMLDTGEFVITHWPTNPVTFLYTYYANTLIGCTEGNGATSNPQDFSTITQANSYDTGTGTTVHEYFTNSSYDIPGRSFEFIPNGQGGYTVFDRPMCTLAAMIPFGDGCPNRPTVYEMFPYSNGGTGTNNIDLSGTSFHFLPNGSGGWTVIPGFSTFYTGFTNNFATNGGTAVSAQSLGFTFNHPAGSDTTIDIHAYGHIWFPSDNGGASHTYGICCGDIQYMLQQTSTLHGMSGYYDWTTGNANGGGMYCDADPSGSAYYVTYDNMPCYGPTAGSATGSTWQMQLYSGGDFELIYTNADNTNSYYNWLVGYCTGITPRHLDPGSTDLTATVPFDTALGGIPLQLQATPIATGGSSRPIIGTTFSCDVNDIRSGSAAGFLVLGFASYGPTGGVNLGAVGAPGCFQWCSLDALVGFPATGTSATVTLPVPNNTGLIGTIVFGQAATYSPGVNPLNVLTSNGTTIQVGL